MELARLTPCDCATSCRPEHEATRAADRRTAEDTSDASPEDRNAQETSRQVCVALAIRSQRAEITRHRDVMAQRLGRHVSLDEAARDWIPKYAAEWRARNGSDFTRVAAQG